VRIYVSVGVTIAGDFRGDSSMIAETLIKLLVLITASFCLVYCLKVLTRDE